MNVWTSYPSGTQVTTITCTYDATNAAGPGQYCTDNGGTTGTSFTVVATYTGTTKFATAGLTI